MLIAKIEYGDGPYTSFFLRKPEVAALMAVASTAKEDVVVQFDPSVGTVYAANSYSILRVAANDFTRLPHQRPVTVGVSTKRAFDFMKRVAASDYLVVCPSADGKHSDVAVVHRKTKTWVPVDGMEPDDMDVVADARFACVDAPAGRSVDCLKNLFPEPIDSPAPPQFSVSSTMFEVLAKIGKATNDKAVAFQLSASPLDPVVAWLADHDDGCTWAFLLMPVRRDGARVQ